MNTNEMHHKPISVVYWPDTEFEHGRVLESRNDVLLEMQATYHGDHDEFWIVELRVIDGSFREVARYNPRFVESWRWA